MATTLKNNANRLNMVDPLPAPLSYRLWSGIFKPRRADDLSARSTRMTARTNGARSHRSCIHARIKSKGVLLLRITRVFAAHHRKPIINLSASMEPIGFISPQFRRGSVRQDKRKPGPPR